MKSISMTRKNSIAKTIKRYIYESRWSLILFAVFMAVMYVPAMAVTRDGLHSRAVWVTFLLLIAGGCVTIMKRAGETASESWSESSPKVYAAVAGVLICLVAALASAGVYQTVLRPLDPQPVTISQQSGEEEAAADDPEELELYSEDQTVSEDTDEGDFFYPKVDKADDHEEYGLKTIAALICGALIGLALVVAVISRLRRKRKGENGSIGVVMGIIMKVSDSLSVRRRERQIEQASGGRQVALVFRDICETLAGKGLKRLPAMTATEFAKETMERFECDHAGCGDLSVLLQTAELYERIMYG